MKLSTNFVISILAGIAVAAELGGNKQYSASDRASPLVEINVYGGCGNYECDQDDTESHAERQQHSGGNDGGHEPNQPDQGNEPTGNESGDDEQLCYQPDDEECYEFEYIFYSDFDGDYTNLPGFNDDATMDLCEFVTMYTCYCSVWGADGWSLDQIGLQEGPEFLEFVSQGVCYLTDGEMEMLYEEQLIEEEPEEPDQPDEDGPYLVNYQSNFMRPGPTYSQIDLTDACGAHNGVCDMNPVYGYPNDNEKAIEYCMDYCTQQRDDGNECFGFFYQKHTNKKEICGFYRSAMDDPDRPDYLEVWDGHLAGAVVRAII